MREAQQVSAGREMNATRSSRCRRDCEKRYVDELCERRLTSGISGERSESAACRG